MVRRSARVVARDRERDGRRLLLAPAGEAVREPLSKRPTLMFRRGETGTFRFSSRVEFSERALRPLKAECPRFHVSPFSRAQLPATHSPTYISGRDVKPGSATGVNSWRVWIALKWPGVVSIVSTVVRYNGPESLICMKCR